MKHKTLPMLLFMLALWSGAKAQFLHSLGDQNSQYGRSVQTATIDQGSILAGYTTPGPLGLNDANLVKTDINGTLQWSQVYGGSQNDYFYSVRNAGNGAAGTPLTYVAAGSTNSFGFGSNDFYLAGTDQFGSLLYSRTYGGPQSDKAYCLQTITDVTGKPGLIMVGETSSFTFFPKKNVYVVKTDLFGNLTNSVVIGTPEDEVGYWIEQTSDRGYILAGYTTQKCTSDTIANKNIYIVKLDPNLNVQWSRIYAGPKSKEDVAFSIRENTYNQSYIVTGNTLSYANGGESFLLNLDLAGNLLWLKVYGGARVENGQNVLVTRDAAGSLQYIVTGYSNSFNTTFNYDALLYKTDIAGTLLWTATYGGTGHEYSYEIDHNNVGGLGYTFAGRTPSFGAGLTDYLHIATDNSGKSSSDCEKRPIQKQKKVLPCVSANAQAVHVDYQKQIQSPYIKVQYIENKCSVPSRMAALLPEEETTASSFMSIAPVPASTAIEVNFKEDCSGDVLNVINAQGSLVKTRTLGEGTLHVGISELPAGIYYLQLIRKDGSTQSSRFVKE